MPTPKVLRLKFDEPLLALLDGVAASHKHANGTALNRTDAVRVAILEAAAKRKLGGKARPRSAKPLPARIRKILGPRDCLGRANAFAG
jgi:hypothetical protein